MLDVDIYPFMLAQEGAGNMPTEVAPSEATGADGTTPAPKSPFGGSFLFLLVGMMVLLLVISTIGPRRERKKREALISAIKKHDRVQTIGGVIGAIVEVKPDEVVLKVDESSNTRITFAKSAITQVLAASGEGKTAPAETDS
jgi:preprotein translocase subunit YajC